MRALSLVFLSMLLLPMISSADEKYSYVGYFAYPEKDLRGVLIEQLPSGKIDFTKLKIPLNISGAIPVGGYVFSHQSRPGELSLSVFGRKDNGFQGLYDCGEFRMDDIHEIHCMKLANTAEYGGTNISGGLSFTSGIINVITRSGGKEFVQGNRLNLSLDKVVQKFTPFESPFTKQSPNAILSHSMSWDATLEGYSTPSAVVFRELSPQNGAGKGKSSAYGYTRDSRITGFSIGRNLGAEYHVAYREQQKVGTPDAKSAVFTGKLTLNLQFFSNGNVMNSAAIGFVPGSIKRASAFKKTGNTNGELFQSVIYHPDGDYIVYTEWLATCKKLGLFFRQRNPDGSFKPARNLENCSTLGPASTVGALGLMVAETYE